MAKGTKAAVLALVVGLLLAGCGGDDKSENASWSSGPNETHCVDGDNKPVDSSWCEEGHREKNDDGSFLETWLMYHLIFGGTFGHGFYSGFQPQPQPQIIYVESQTPRNYRRPTHITTPASLPPRTTLPANVTKPTTPAKVTAPTSPSKPVVTQPKAPTAPKAPSAPKAPTKPASPSKPAPKMK